MFNAEAVPVMLVPIKADGVPKFGVTKVGDVSITNLEPVPVCEATDVVFPTLVIGPVKFALVVTVAAFPPMLNPEAVPVMLVPTKADGVPKFGVTKVGELDKTTLPVPVEVVTPVPPLATPSVPVILLAGTDELSATRTHLFTL